MGDRFGDVNPAFWRRIELEEPRVGRREAKLIRPCGIAHSRLPTPACKAVIETLAADLPFLKVVAARRPYLLDRQDLFVDRPDVGDVGVEAGVQTAGEIRMLPQA